MAKTKKLLGINYLEIGLCVCECVCVFLCVLHLKTLGGTSCFLVPTTVEKLVVSL